MIIIHGQLKFTLELSKNKFKNMFKMKKFDEFNQFINESKSSKGLPEKVEKFLKQFPDDTDTWKNATDEIRDIARNIKDLYNERNEDNKIEALNFRKINKPSEWNTEGKKYIRMVYGKMCDVCKKAFKKYFDEHFGHNKVDESYSGKELFAFDGTFYLETVNSYNTSERKFGGDMIGDKGGNMFDFSILTMDINEVNDKVQVEFSGSLFIDENTYTNDEISNLLSVDISWYVESYTEEFPKDFNLTVV